MGLVILIVLIIIGIGCLVFKIRHPSRRNGYIVHVSTQFVTNPDYILVKVDGKWITLSSVIEEIDEIRG